MLIVGIILLHRWNLRALEEMWVGVNHDLILHILILPYGSGN
jgi:hypothetical protein